MTLGGVHETIEARDIREAYNGRRAQEGHDDMMTAADGVVQSSTSEGSSAHHHNVVFFPCPAGIALVDLDQLEEAEQAMQDGGPRGISSLTAAMSAQGRRASREYAVKRLSEVLRSSLTSNGRRLSASESSNASANSMGAEARRNMSATGRGFW